MIKLRNVSVTFGHRQVLSPLNIDLNHQKTAVIGANGSGKSTFARLLNGLILPTTGSITVAGLDTRKKGKEVRRLVGFVFQNPDNQIVMPIVEEDLAFGLRNIGLPQDQVKLKIDKVLARYNLEDKRHYPVYRLSGGQKQLIAICGVIIMEPRIIIFDEPTTQLDLMNKQKVANLIDQLSQQVIVVTHDLDLVETFDRVLVFHEGKLICDDIPLKAIKTYKALVASL